MGRKGVRNEIVGAGLRVFRRNGFNATSVQDITTEAEVPKGSFYNHFESKEALGAEIVDLYGDGGDLRAALRDKTLLPLERLRRHFSGLNTFFQGNQWAYGCLLGNFSAEVSDQSELIRQRLMALYSRWSGEMEEAIALAQERGEVSRDAPAADIAAFLLDSYEGALLRARVEKNGKAFERFMHMAFDRILK